MRSLHQRDQNRGATKLLRRRVGSIGAAFAAVAAVVVVGAVIVGVVHKGGIGGSGEAGVPAVHGYGRWQADSYQKLLGFTPVLPTSVSHGVAMSMTAVSRYSGVPGKGPGFTALYMSGQGSTRVLDFAIYESSSAKSLNLSQGWKSFKVNGNLAGAKKVLSFPALLPTFVPDGFTQKSVYGTSVRTQKKEVSEQITILYVYSGMMPIGSHSMTSYEVVEGRVAPPQPGGQGSAAMEGTSKQTQMQIGGKDCEVTTYSNNHGVVVVWTDPATGVWYRVGSANEYEDKATL